MSETNGEWMFVVYARKGSKRVLVKQTVDGRVMSDSQAARDQIIKGALDLCDKMDKEPTP